MQARAKRKRDSPRNGERNTRGTKKNTKGTNKTWPRALLCFLCSLLCVLCSVPDFSWAKPLRKGVPFGCFATFIEKSAHPEFLDVRRSDIVPDLLGSRAINVCGSSKSANRHSCR